MNLNKTIKKNKKIIIVFTLFLFMYFCFYYGKFSYPKIVTVVGNGPISEKQRNEINKQKWVIRFNEFKNFKQGDKVDEHVILGYDEKKIKSILEANSINEYDRNIRVTLITEEGKNISHDNLIERDNSSYNCFDPIGPDKKDIMEVNNRPTAGMIILSVLQSDDNVDTIRVYGMNSNYTGDWHSKKEQKIKKKYCTKCIFYKTTTDSYN